MHGVPEHHKAKMWYSWDSCIFRINHLYCKERVTSNVKDLSPLFLKQRQFLLSSRVGSIEIKGKPCDSQVVKAVGSHKTCQGSNPGTDVA